MPIVELVAKKILRYSPDIGLNIIDLIVLLWLYSNPYESKRRQLSSMKNVLRMTESIQSPDGGVPITDDELTQIVLGSLDRLKRKGLAYIRSSGHLFVKGTLTEKGVRLVEGTIDTPSLRRVTAEFGNNP
ncbi:MAG: hypothetical protein K9W43_09755 [Candidatus Thorarchaeota archaeon]|nr:hypothetical protein [Candidatus Thorarchaeota archaeon]